MNRTKTLKIQKIKFYSLVQFIVLLAIATTAPLLQNQYITGPIVNATLFISTVLLGLQGAILIALVPSLIALSIGLLSPVLAPMVPFIMMGNILLILIFNYLRKYNFWSGVVPASILKFIFLFSTSHIVINLLLKKEVASKIAVILSWPQLLTALIGGIVAFGFLKAIKKI